MTDTITTRFAANGLTCGHCVTAVTDEFSALPGVAAVRVDLIADGASLVEVDGVTALTVAAVEGALDEAGDYVLVGDVSS